MAHEIDVGTGNEGSEFTKLFRELRLVSKNIENLKNEKFKDEIRSSLNLENVINDKIYEIDKCLKLTKRFINHETESLVISKILEIRRILDDYYVELEGNNFLFDFDSELVLDNIVDELESIIRGDVGEKLAEYGKYYEKIEPLIKIENNLLKLEELFVETEDGSDNQEVAITLNNIKAINSFFKNRDKYKFLLFYLWNI